MPREHINVTIDEWLEPPPEFLHAIRNLPNPVQVALIAWFVNDLYLEDVTELYDWFGLETPVDDGWLHLAIVH